MKRIFLILLLPLLLSHLSYGFTIKPSTGEWSSTYLDKCRYTIAPNKKLWITLRDNEYSADDKLDLLLHFNKDKHTTWPSSDIGSYIVKSRSFWFSPYNKIFGASSAKFTYKSSLVLTPTTESWFNKQEHAGDFTIEFWANPALLSDGEIILKRYGPVVENGVVSKYSGIVSSIKNKRVVFDFHNFFNLPNFINKKSTKPLISIAGKAPLRTFKWTHHAITFDSLTGKLTYYVNAKEEASIFVTASGQSEDTILIPSFYKQEKLPLIIGDGYYGYLDELSISKVVKYPKNQAVQSKQGEQSYFNITPYANAEGSVTSNIYDIGYMDSSLQRMQMLKDVANKSHIDIKYRIRNKFFTPDNNDIAWHDIDETKRAKGRYFQWKATLTSGYNGSFAPVLKDISFIFTRNLEPKAPVSLFVTSKDNKALLTWSANLEEDLAYYKIYYGKEEGNYLASKKPLKVSAEETPSITIHDLEANKIYFFAISAVDKSGHESTNSQEVSVVIRK